LRDRGLGSHVDSVLHAVVPLYMGSRHVGHGYGLSGRCYTTCDPDSGPLSVGPGNQPLVFSEPSGFWYSASCQGLPSAAVVRKPNYYERTVVIGRDAEGPYYSSVARVIHVGVAAKNFSIEGLEGDTELPFEGGLVMSLVDGAVLGALVKQSESASFGVVEFCVSIPTPSLSEDGDHVRRVDAIRKAFPALRPEAWSSGIVEEVFTHGSVGTYSVPSKKFNDGVKPLAFIGSAAVNSGFGSRARVVSFPFEKWQPELNRVTGSRHLASLSSRLGLDVLMEFGPSVTPSPPGAAVYADVLLAVVGAAKLYEVESVFEELLDVLFSALESVVSAPFGPHALDKEFDIH